MARLRLRRPRSPHLHRPPESPRLRSLASQSLIYGMGGIVSKLVGVFLLPIYVKPEYAGRAAFGTSELVMAAITALAIFLRLGITNSMSRFTVGDPDNHDWKPGRADGVRVGADRLDGGEPGRPALPDPDRRAAAVLPHRCRDRASPACG